MLFTSYAFIFFFLPLLLLGWQMAAQAARPWLPTLLLAVSALFYALWGVRFFALLAFMVCGNYAFGVALDAWSDAAAGRLTRKRLLGLAVLFNLLPLCWFKYSGFLADNVGRLLGESLHFQPPGLPLGISFYTFLQIAWLVTVYRRQIRPEGFLRYAAFATCFPYVISGPIARWEQIAPQLQNLGPLTSERAAQGLTLFVMGLGKKVLLADTLAAWANSIFGAAEKGFPLTGAEAWVGSLAYTFQLYFDFSGYTDMAIGLGLLLGLRLPDNFLSPYKSTGIVDFWRRWHITLGTWLRDFLYIPLGGSREGMIKQYRNLFLIMLLGGVWHGAGWSFAVWGALHGAMLCINHGFRRWAKDRLSGEVLRHPALRLSSIALTFLCVNAAWVVFRAQSLAGAGRMYKAMWDGPALSWGACFPNNYVSDPGVLWLLGLCGALCWLFPNTNELVFGGGGRFSWKASKVWAVGLAASAAASLVMLSRKSVFLYFNF